MPHTPLAPRPSPSLCLSLQDPANERFRRVKSEHARFRVTVGALPGATAFMAAVGWALETEGGGVQLWVLRGEDVAPRMAAAVAILDAARAEAEAAQGA